MGRLTDRLKGHTVISLDTPVFIYHLEAHPRYMPLTQELLTGVQAGHWAAWRAMSRVTSATARWGK